MDIIIDISKSFSYNLKKIYEKYKRLKEVYEKKLNEKTRYIVKGENKKRKIEKKWYEKFRWFYTSNNFLVISGKDKKTNEIIIRKYMRDKDIVIHADIVGSPFGIIRVENERPKDIDIYEACQFVASYSRAWKAGLTSVRVFWVNANQVSKRAPSGEYLGLGSFMIYGKKNFLDVKLELAFGIKGKNFIHGVPSSVRKKSEKYIVIVPGEEDQRKIAEKISKILGVDIETVIRWIPSWGARIKGTYKSS